MNKDEEFYKAAIRQIDSLMPHEKAWGSTVALVIERGSRFHQFGTGTLFRIADESFLVTAMHVIEDANVEGNRLLISAPQGRFVPTGPQALLGERETFDVAVIQLPEKVVAYLEEKTFLRMDDICLRHQLSQGMFAIFGFPEMMSFDEGGKFLLTRFHLMTYAFDGDTTPIKFDPNHHLLLKADQSEVRGLDGKPMPFCYRGGVPAPFPDELKGISGGSVWKISDTSDGVRSQGSGSARIVAVETGVFPRQACIKSTRWNAVRSIIYDAFPELRPSMDLWRPS